MSEEALDATTNSEGGHPEREKVSSELIVCFRSLTNCAHGLFLVTLDFLAWPRAVRSRGGPWLSLGESRAQEFVFTWVARNRLKEQEVDDEWK